MSSSRDNTTLFLELSKAFLSTQFLAAKNGAKVRDNSVSGKLFAMVGLRGIPLSESKQTTVDEFAAKFQKITFSAPVVFVSNSPPYPPERIEHGVVYVYINKKHALACTLRAPWGDVVTEEFQAFKTPAQIDPHFLEINHVDIKVALVNKGLILEMKEAVTDSCAKGVLQNLIQRCLMELENIAGSTGTGIMGEDLNKLAAFVETLYRKFEMAQLLSVPYLEQDAFTFFRKYAGAYLLDKLWKKKTTAWDVYREAGTEKEAMLIRVLDALAKVLHRLPPNDREAREDSVCQAIESILLQNHMICQRHGLQMYMPLSAVVGLPLSVSFSTSALEPGKGELEQVFAVAYRQINPKKSVEFLTRYINKAKEDAAVSAAPSSHSARFFPPPASTALLGYYPQPGYAESSGYPGHLQHSEYSPFMDTSRSSAYMPSHLPPGEPAYPVFPERPAFPGHVPRPMSRPPLPPKPAELAGQALPPAPAQYALPEGVQDTTPSAEPASPSFT